MDAGLFTKMLSDKSVTDLKKLKYKYPQADLAEFVSLLKGSFYHALPLKDFDGGQMVYLESVAQVRLSAARVLLTPQDSSQPSGAAYTAGQQPALWHQGDGGGDRLDAFY